MNSRNSYEGHAYKVETVARSGIDDEHTPTCSCGWKGWVEYSHNDYCWTNLRDQYKRHLNDA